MNSRLKTIGAVDRVHIERIKKQGLEMTAKEKEEGIMNRTVEYWNTS